MSVTRIQGGAIFRRSPPCAVRRGVQRALTCLLAGSVPLLAVAQTAPAADAPAQTASPGSSAADLQQRLQRLEQNQQALQRQLQENAAEIEALKKQANVPPAQPAPSARQNVPVGAAGPAAADTTCPTNASARLLGSGIADGPLAQTAKCRCSRWSCCRRRRRPSP